MDLKKYKHIHCIGIGGIGLSGIALVLAGRGIAVSGSDMKESEMTEKLRKAGITVYIGHRAENVEGADLLIYSAAVPVGNPEMKEAVRRGIPAVSRAEALGAVMAEYEKSLAVCGTHGKTTTTSMVSLILDRAKYDPTMLVGGVVAEFGSNVRTGKSPYIVAEACEFVDSFLELRPRAEIILNIDSDHLDYFGSIGNIVRSFSAFAHFVPADGVIFAYDSNAFVQSVTGNLPCRVVRFGFSEGSDFYARNISFDEQGHASYDLYGKEGYITDIHLAVMGEHNVANSLAAIAACTYVGVPVSVCKQTLEGFAGTHRRFDILGKSRKGFTVVEDYGHHPTEILATLAAAKNIVHNKIWCIFQPHTYSRLHALFSEFADAFGDADRLVLAEIYAAREKNTYNLSSAALLAEIQKRHPEKDAVFIPDFGEIASYVCRNAERGDIVIVMGAGDINKTGPMILEGSE